MKSVVVICGSPRPKGNTFKIVSQVEAQLRLHGEVNVEHVHLKKSNIEYCRGCLACMRRGEQRCPCHDDLLGIRDKLRAADSVIFACPVYVHTVPALMKNFFDRLAFQCHQPAYQDKAALLVTTTELTGAAETLDYLEFVTFTWGFRIAGKLDVVYPGYLREGAYRAATERRIGRAAAALWEAMTTPQPAPSLQQLAFFRLMRTKVTFHREHLPRDYEYWQERGWLNRRYYDERPIPALKQLLARTLVRLRVRRLLHRSGLDEPPPPAAAGPACPP